MTVNRVYEEYPMSQTNHYGSYPGSDAQLTDKLQELGSNDNVVDGDGENE